MDPYHHYNQQQQAAPGQTTSLQDLAKLNATDSLINLNGSQNIMANFHTSTDQQQQHGAKSGLVRTVINDGASRNQMGDFYSAQQNTHYQKEHSSYGSFENTHPNVAYTNRHQDDIVSVDGSQSSTTESTRILPSYAVADSSNRDMDVK